MEVIKKCLNDFASASGHHINMEKSRLFFSPNFDRTKAGGISKEAGIPMTDNLGDILEVSWSIKDIERPCIPS